MGIFVKDRTIRRAKILRPLVFNMDQRPLAAAEPEMLQTGKLEEILLGIDHPIRVQVTPSGRSASATATV